MASGLLMCHIETGGEGLVQGDQRGKVDMASDRWRAPQ